MAVELIKPEDSPKEFARKMFYTYENMMSATIVGFEVDDDTGELEPKGEIALKWIERFDKLENYTLAGKTAGNGMRRRRIKPPNTIGDYLRNKIFRWEKRIVDNKIRYSVWRIQ